MTAKPSGPAQIIRLKNTLIQKLGGAHLAGRGVDPAVLQRMEKAMEAFVRQRPTLIAELIDRLEAALADANAKPAGPGRFATVFECAHEIRSFGGSFGFPVITRIGRTLTAYLETLGEAEEPDPRLVALHVEAIVAAAKGEQGERAAAVADELDQIVRALQDTSG